MKKILVVVLAVLLIAAFTVPTLAWEFDLKGDFLYKYDYFTQTGKAGFFGPFDVQNPALNVAPSAALPGINWAAMNGWMGARTFQGGTGGVQWGLVTGEDGSFNYQRMEFYPEIRLNPAIRLRGIYQIGGLANSVSPAFTGAFAAGTGTPPNAFTYGVYANAASFGAWNPIDTGSWTQWWATCQTPWGILVFGKRGFGFGLGVTLVESNASSESLALVVPYGPLRIGLGGYLHRRQTFVNAAQSGVFGSATGVTVPSGNTGGTVNVSFFDGATAPKRWDHDSERHGEPFVFVTYQSGDLDIGASYEWFFDHDGPQARAQAGAAGAVVGMLAHDTTVTRDEAVEDGLVYLKYNNGRFFFNSELSWTRFSVHYQLPQNLGLAPAVPILPAVAGSGSPYAPYDTEAWWWGTELGTICGPSKLTLMYSWTPGPDRRAGIWINHQSWENIINGTFIGNSQFFKPYSLLLAYQYGAGLNAVDVNGEGYMTDANTWAARLDYAVAANLNFYGTFMYATRTSKGWGWGCLAPGIAGDGTPSALLLGRAQGTGAYLPATNNGYSPGATNIGAPNIPDDALGWEVDAGIDWKLLEGLQLAVRGAYWEPGNWFKFACVDRSLATRYTVNGFTAAAPGTGATAGTTHLMPNATDGTAIGSSWGVNPSKDIDPIWGVQGTLMVDF